MNLAKSRTGTSAEYTRRINKVLEFIDNHIDQALQLDDLAKVSYFSAYHFHRIFCALVGETVNEYVTRKRMERSVHRLMGMPELSITGVADLGGFSSSANFSRAFKLYFGISPSELRKAGNSDIDFEPNSKFGKLYSKYGKAFNPRDLYSQFVTQEAIFEPNKLKESLMQVRVEDITEKTVVSLGSPEGYVLESVYETWDKLMQWADSHGVVHEWATCFALCHDNPAITAEDKCRYDATIVIEPDLEVAAPFAKSAIPGGKYAIAGFRDEASKINQFMTELCSKWLCDSGYEPDDYPPIFNYLSENRDDDIVDMNIYIKLKDLAVRK